MLAGDMSAAGVTGAAIDGLCGQRRGSFIGRVEVFFSAINIYSDLRCVCRCRHRGEPDDRQSVAAALRGRRGLFDLEVFPRVRGMRDGDRRTGGAVTQGVSPK